MFDTQVTIAIYILIALFGGAAIYKAMHKKPEWILLLIILSYIKGVITYLFQATTVFTVFTVGATEVHLDDIILLVITIYCVAKIIGSVKGKSCLVASLLIVVPFVLAIFRGIFIGSHTSPIFINDIRKFGLFVIVFIGVYFVLRDVNLKDENLKLKKYIDKLMLATMVLVFTVWILDIGFGINDLPGQINGTLSDGGSTFRVLSPIQAFAVAFYTLYSIYYDLFNKNRITIKTLLFIFMIILLQWRTVVAAFLIGAVLILCLFFSKRGISRNIVIEVIIVAMLGFALPFLTGSNDIMEMADNLFNSFSSVTEETGTFSTRTYIWNMMLGALHGKEALFGIPFGRVLNIPWKASAHSGYVDYIVKFGYVGLSLLICFLLFLIFKSLNNKDKYHLIAIFVIVFAVFWIGYGMSIEQGAILGGMLAILDHKQRYIMIDDDEDGDEDKDKDEITSPISENVR